MRFPGFEGEWETKKLGEVCKMQAGKFVSVSDIYVKPNEDLFPCYGGNGLRGYTKSFNYDGIYSLIGRQGALCGNVTLARKRFHATEHAVVVKPKVGMDSLWMFYLLTYLDLNQYATGMAQPGLSVQNLEKVELKVPDSKEQERISGLLKLIDDRVQTQNKIIEGLKLSKQTLIKKIFSQQVKFKDNNGNSYPIWRLEKLGDVTILVNKRNKKNEKLPVYSINNKLGFVPQNEQFEGMDSDDRGYDIKLYKVIDKNTFAYNPARINVGSIGYSRCLKNIIISSLYVCFLTKDSVNDNFLFQYLKTRLFNKEVLKNVEGGVREYLFYENFARIKFNMPCIEEQAQIANFLSTFDNKIDIEINFLQKLKEQKEFLLQNLFV